MKITRWRPASFTWHFRRKPPEPPVERWEELLEAERTITFQLMTRVARSSVALRKVFGVPAQLAQDGAPSLRAREQRLNLARSTTLGRLLNRRGRGPRSTKHRADGDMPRVGPVVDREINAALALLGSMAFEEVQRRGWHLQPNHFYWPLNDLAFLRENPELWAEPRLPADIEWDLDGQEELIRSLAKYSSELADVRAGPPDRPGEFAWSQNFDGLDAYSYYGLVRNLQPANVIEIGIGTSSTLLARALAANEQGCEVTLIDPRPRWEVLGELPSDWQVIPSVVQHVDLEVFSRLGPGDILFYDGSHCVRTGSDVNWMFFEVLPRLARGVWIHIHDISWPRDYSPEWILDEGLSWNEQYLVQAFLAHNASYRVRLGSVMLNDYKRPLLGEVLPDNIGGASSLWLEKVR